MQGDTGKLRLSPSLIELEEEKMLNLISYHAVMLDETGCEFGVDVEAESKDKAHDIIAEDYPESRCVQLESPAEARDRERRMYESILQEDEDYDYEDYNDYDEEE